MKIPKQLSIIIVSYNTKVDLKLCLTSVYQHTHDLDFEIIVVDNASTDGSPQLVTKLFPQVTLIKSATNLGFGKANNLGATKAKGEYLLFLNPDTLISDNAFKESLTIAKSIDNLGAYSCRLVFADGSTQPSGGYFPTLIRLFAWHTALDEIPLLNSLIKPIHPAAYFYRHSFSPDWITGAFMLIPASVFNRVKGFDERIFMYGEELELCYRLKRSGYKIYYSTHPTITHLQAKASSSDFALLSEIAGIKYFFAKHMPKWQLPIVDLLFKLGSLLRLLLFGIILGNASKKAVYQKALKL